MRSFTPEFGLISSSTLGIQPIVQHLRVERQQPAEAVWKPTESSPDMGANRSLGVFESRLGDFVNWPR